MSGFLKFAFGIFEIPKVQLLRFFEKHKNLKKLLCFLRKSPWHFYLSIKQLITLEIIINSLSERISKSTLYFRFLAKVVILLRIPCSLVTQRTCEANAAGENSSFIFTVCVKSVPRYHFKLSYVVLHMALNQAISGENFSQSEYVAFGAISQFDFPPLAKGSIARSIM